MGCKEKYCFVNPSSVFLTNIICTTTDSHMIQSDVLWYWANGLKSDFLWAESLEILTPRFCRNKAILGVISQNIFENFNQSKTEKFCIWKIFLLTPLYHFKSSFNYIQQYLDCTYYWRKNGLENSQVIKFILWNRF